MDRRPTYSAARRALPGPRTTTLPVLSPISPALRRRGRRGRSRRPELVISTMVLLALVAGACAMRPRVAPVPVPVQPAGGAGGGTGPAIAQGPAAAGTAGAAGTPGAAVRQTGAEPAVVAGPPLTFSFAKFEADAALVAGAASTGVPTLSGESAIVVDVNSKDVLYAKQPRKRLLVASTAKIMTAIVAAEWGPLDRVITVPPEATEVEPNHMGIRAGEKLTVQELLYGLLLDSGNDAAEALAIGLGGAAGRAQFISRMNQKALTYGLKDTSFANPSGLDDPEQYSTAYDLAILGAHALAKPELRAIFGAKEMVIQPSREPGREHGWFGPGNLNSLLWSYRGAIGIKPGYTEDAGYTLVAAAERDGRTLVAVTLNSRRHFTDCALLLDFGFGRT